MTNSTGTPISDLVLSQSIIGAFVSPSTQTLETTFALVSAALIFMWVAVTAVTIAVFVSASINESRSNRSINIAAIIGAVGFFLATLFAPLATLASAIRQLAQSTIAFLVNNFVPIAGILALSGVAWGWTAYYNIFITVIIFAYEAVIMPTWRVVPLYGAILLELFLAAIVPWTNLLVIRIPASLVTGLFFDLGTCSADAFVVFFGALVQFFIELANAIDLYASSGQDALVVLPDFTGAGQQLAVVVGTLNTFLACFCASAQTITDPFFAALTDGNPAIVEDVVPFAQTVNSTLNLPFAVVVDIVRPIVDLVQALEDEDDDDDLRSVRLSFNGTVATARRFVNSSLGIFDNVVQQYWVALIDDITDGDPPLAQVPGPPPRLLTCATGALFWPIESYNWLLNILFRIIETFETFNGQTNLYFDEVLDVALDTLYCVCDLVNWIGDFFRAIGDDIEGGSGECNGISGGSIGEDIGGCIFYLIAGVIDGVCCFYETSIVAVAEFFTLFWKLLWGTIFTVIYRIDDIDDNECDNVTPDEQFYCSVPRNALPYVGLDFFMWQNGLRRSLPQTPTACPSQLCYILEATSSEECAESAQYGIADNLNAQYGRCLHSSGSCAAQAPVNPPENCLRNLGGGMSTIFSCSGGTCIDTLGFSDFESDCVCASNEWRSVFLAITQGAECIGRIVTDTFGPGAEFVQCFIVNIASLVAELLAATVSFISQLGVLIVQPSQLDVSSRELDRAIRGISNCVAVAIAAFPDLSVILDEGGQPQTPVILTVFEDALSKSFATYGQIIDCVTGIILTIFNAIVETLNLLAVWAREGTPPSNFDFIFVAVVDAILQLFALFLWFLSAIFYGLAAVPPGSSGLIGVGDALGFGDEPPPGSVPNGAAAFIKDQSTVIAQVIVDVVVFLIECLIALILTPITGLACISQLASGCTDCNFCDQFIDSLIPCIELLGQLLIDLINLICQDCLEFLFCFARGLACVIGLGDEIPIDPYCSDTSNPLFVSDDRCDEIYILCFVESVLCELRIPVDLGCAVNDVCDNRAIWCFAFDVACAFDLVILFIGGLIEDVVNFFIDFINDIGGIIGDIGVTFCEVAACSFLDFDIAGCDDAPDCDQCCQDEFGSIGSIPQFNDITNDFPYVTENLEVTDECCDVTNPGLATCFNTAYIKYTNNAGNCVVTEMFGCYRTLNDPIFAINVLQQVPNPTCCSTPGAVGCARKRSYDEHGRLEPPHVVVARQMGMERRVERLTASVLDAYRETTDVRRTSTLGAYCAELVDEALSHVDSVPETWTRTQQVLLMREDIGAFERMRMSLCQSYLETTVASLEMRTAMQRAAPDDVFDLSQIEPHFETNFSRMPVMTPLRLYGPKVLASIASVDVTPAVWLVGASLSTTINTVRLLGRYAFDESLPTVAGADLLYGRPLAQLDERNCHAMVMPGAILADALTPTVGNGLRALARTLRSAAHYANAIGKRVEASSAAVVRRGEQRELVRRAVAMMAPIATAVGRANVPAAAAEGVRILAAGAHVRLQHRLDAAAGLTVGDIEAVVTVATEPRSPQVALKRQRLAERWAMTDETAEQVAAKRTADEERTGKISRWSRRVMQRARDKRIRLLRRALYGTENYAEIQQILAARILNGGCDLRQSPWQCCTEQTLCINCSFLDRVFWAGQDGLDAIVQYYAGDLRTRFLPCVAAQAATVNFLIVPPSLECPAAVCAQPECQTDNDCALAFGSPPATCNPTLGRCILQDSAQCAGQQDETCFREVGGGSCRVGTCSMGCQLAGATFPCQCRCADTWVTKEKLVPSLFDRFTELEVPCLLSYSCVIDSIRPDGVNTTVPEDQPFRNTWYNIKTRGDATTPNVDVSFVASLDEAFNGAGTSIITSIENLAFQFSSLGENVEWAENFANEFVFCDYRDDLYCPLADDSPSFGCCSDRCEVREQGTNLFNGIVFALLVLIVPLTLCNCFRVLAGLGSCWTLVWLVLVVPLVQQFAYGGGLLCYTPGPIVFATPLLDVISTLLVTGVFVAFALCGCLLRCVTCNFCFGSFEGQCRVSPAFFSGICRIFLGGIVAFIAFFAFLPGLSVCTSLDIYNLASELVPPCFPFSTVLIDRRQEGAYLPCGQTLGGTAFDPDTIILCATTDLLPKTRFLDGLDNILYAAEQIEPGCNERLIAATAGTPLQALGVDYAPFHTTEAHNSELVEGLSEACFWITTPSIFLSSLLLVIDFLLAGLAIAFIMLALALVITPLFWGIYAIWLGLDALRNGWVLRRDDDGGVADRDPNFFDGKPGGGEI